MGQKSRIGAAGMGEPCRRALSAFRFSGRLRSGEARFYDKAGRCQHRRFELHESGVFRGDDRERVLENYRRIGKALEMPVSRMVLSQQTHTTHVRIVTEEDAGSGITRPLPYTDVDGLVTNVCDLPLVTFYADCVPLFFVDPGEESHRSFPFRLAGHCEQNGG